MEQSIGVRKKGLSNSSLKMIAISMMLLDHISTIVLTTENLFAVPYMPIIADSFHFLGRMAFPIFAFLIVEGFYHTSNLKKYMGRLLAFAFISEIPYDFAFVSSFFDPMLQNVFFTLFIGLITVYFVDRYKGSTIIQFAVVFIFSIISLFVKCDYEIIGIVMMVMFYIYREDKRALAAVMLVIFSFFAIVYNNWMYLGVFLSMPLILMYNGEKGNSLKYVFYGFYPVHLIVLAIIAKILI